MKQKMFAVCLVLSLCVCLLSGVSLAAGDAATVKVTIASAGELVLVNQPVEAMDRDGDGSLTVYDVLTITHELYYKGSEESGFVTTEEGFITKLWGVENGGSYGYYLNHTAAMSLFDPVKEGDYLAAYSYADLDAWSDMYTYFESTETSCAPETELPFQLMGAGYDESWAPVSVPVAGATILVNNEETTFVTDENGKTSIKFDEPGTYTVSAVSTKETIVPPVCIVTVKEENAGETEAGEESTEVEAPAFTDISGHWGEKAIRYVVEKGYLRGTSDTVFAPDSEVSRAMLVTVLFRMAGEPVPTAEIPFTDLAQDMWYTDAVQWAAETGLVLGDQGQYRPDDVLTRQETVLILYRWAQEQGLVVSKDISLTDYEDAASVADWARDAMAWGCAEGIITGTSATMLEPERSLSRAELAQMLMRLLEE